MARIYGTKTLAELKESLNPKSWEDSVASMGYTIDPETGQVRTEDYGIADTDSLYSDWSRGPDYQSGLWSEGYQKLPDWWTPEGQASERYRAQGMRTLLDAQRSTDPGGRYIAAGTDENPFEFPVWELSDQWRPTEQLEGDEPSLAEWLGVMGMGFGLSGGLAGISSMLGGGTFGAGFGGFTGGLTNHFGLTGEGGLFGGGDAAWGVNPQLASNMTTADLLNLADPQNAMLMSRPGISTPGLGALGGVGQTGRLFGNAYNQQNTTDFGASGLNEFGPMNGQALPSESNFVPGSFGLGTTATGGAAASGLGGGSMDFLGELFRPSTLLNLAGNIGGSLISANAAQKAAGIQSDAAAGSNALLASIYSQNRADLEPWRQTGISALNRLADVTKPGSQQAQMELDPGYQFRLGEGLKGIERSAAARGVLQSGGTLKGINRYAQDYASNEYGNVVNRLLAQAGMGQTATNTGVQAGQNYGSQAANNLLGAGNARASGYVGQSNAISQGVGGFLNSYNQNALIDKLLGSR